MLVFINKGVIMTTPLLEGDRWPTAENSVFKLRNEDPEQVRGSINIEAAVLARHEHLLAVLREAGIEVTPTEAGGEDRTVTPCDVSQFLCKGDLQGYTCMSTEQRAAQWDVMSHEAGLIRPDETRVAVLQSVVTVHNPMYIEEPFTGDTRAVPNRASGVVYYEPRTLRMLMAAGAHPERYRVIDGVMAVVAPDKVSVRQDVDFDRTGITLVEKIEAE